MRNRLAGFVAGIACAAFLLQAPASSQPAPKPGNVNQSRVLSAADSANNWMVYGGNFESQHFSPLNAVNDKNIGKLGLAWSADVDSPMGLALEPIVIDGVIYIGLPLDVVEAFDGVTGKILWRFDPKIRINGPWRNSY